MQLSGRDSNVYGVWVRGCMLLYKKENQPYRKKNTANMKSILLTAMMLLSGLAATAQTDPTIMTIDGKPVSRSEFEYSYNKNNSETVVDKKSVADYVDLFINYKLKVLAAEAAGIDTTESFRKEFLTYRDQQIRPAFIAPDDLKREAWKVYVETRDRIDSTGGMVRPAHILVMLQQKATKAQEAAAKQRIDSIAKALAGGADFAALAAKCSDDKGSAKRGGDISWICKGQTLKEFEDVVYGMKEGEVSKPFLSPVGYHIVKLLGRQSFFPYDSLKADIERFVSQDRVRERIISQNIDSIAKSSVPAITAEQVVDRKAAEMEAADSDLKNLVREYHDGLLLYEISNRTVWEKAAKDEAGQEAFFKKNKKKYAWDAPRYKGMAYNTKDAADIEAVKAAVKDLPFEEWAETLRKTFNDSIRRIQVVKGIFKRGDNALVDKDVFAVDTVVNAPKGYPYSATYGKTLKAPESWRDVREQVVADYQDLLEKKWVAELRKRYKVKVDKKVLSTVNKH